MIVRMYVNVFALVLGGFKFDKQQLDMNLGQFEITYILQKFR